MDLSFPPFDQHAELTSLPSDLAVLLVGVAARQAASATAAAQAGWRREQEGAAEARLFAPLHGAFNGPMAATVARWRQE